jgi:hypothetical protein
MSLSEKSAVARGKPSSGRPKLRDDFLRNRKLCFLATKCKTRLITNDVTDYVNIAQKHSLCIYGKSLLREEEGRGEPWFSSDYLSVMTATYVK